MSAPEPSDAVIDLLTDSLRAAWSSFERPRTTEPTLDARVHAALSAGLPEGPSDPSVSLADAVAVLESSVSPARPLYLAYVGSTGLQASAMGAALAATYDVNLAARAGAIELLEAQTLRWMADFVGYPMEQGIFTSGGMTSNLTALVAARERAAPGSRADGLGGRPVSIFCSTEAHHSVVRAAEIIGVGTSAVRKIAIDDRRRMRPDALAAALDADRHRGVLPIAVVATAGTTLTGAVDPLDRISDVCAERGVWLHVDGAYGLPAAAVPRTSGVFAGLDRADSVTVDAHKWMGIQKSCSLLLLRHRDALTAAFGHREDYMPLEGRAGNPVDATLEYSRPVSSVKLWTAMRTHGAATYRRWIDDTIDLAQYLEVLLREHTGYECLHEPTLSALCFRQISTGMRDANDHNARLAAAVRADGRTYLAPATMDGKVCLRVCFTNFRTRREHVDELVAVLDELGLLVRHKALAS